jgi:hypothetical protein
MKRLWKIFVLSMAISLLLAPTAMFCAPHQPQEHACCATEAQLTSLSCCPDAAPPASIPMQPIQSLDQVLSDSAVSPLSVSLLSLQQPVIAWPRPTFLPPILLPATILRT